MTALNLDEMGDGTFKGLLKRSLFEESPVLTYKYL